MEGVLSKYLIYAIGEILLVVIGILIALQINSVNENRLERIEERKYLRAYFLISRTTWKRWNAESELILKKFKI